MLTDLVNCLISQVSCWNCGKFGFLKEFLVERPDGLHDDYLLCKHCRKKSADQLKQELYPENDYNL